MNHLSALVIFAQVVESGSFSAAAKRLAMPISTVSRKVAELEDQLGVRLLERTTRKLRLTDIGQDILGFAQKGSELEQSIKELIANQHHEVEGLLRISAPPSITDTIIAPIATAFQTRYPKVRLLIQVTDRFVDHIADGVDVVFRTGELADSTLVAHTLLRYRHRLVASPAYLEREGEPKTPQDLLDHRLLAFSQLSAHNKWVLHNKKHSESISFQPSLSMNDYVGLAKALASGVGIGELPPIVCPQYLTHGELVEIMPNWHFASKNISLVHLGNKHMPRVVRTFKDFAIKAAPELFDNLSI